MVILQSDISLEQINLRLIAIVWLSVFFLQLIYILKYLIKFITLIFVEGAVPQGIFFDTIFRNFYKNS